jgi:hypothetical protein
MDLHKNLDLNGPHLMPKLLEDQQGNIDPRHRSARDDMVLSLELVARGLRLP